MFAVAFTVYAVSPVRQNYDSYLAFPTAQSALHDANLSLNEFNTPKFDTQGSMEITDNGTELNTYPWVPSMFLAPSVLALDLANAVGIGPGSHSVANGGRMDVIQQLNASVVVALVVALVFAIAFLRLDPAQSLRRRRRIAGLVAFGFAFGTAAWSTASRAMWQHGPSLLFLAIAVLCAQQLLTDPDSDPARQRWLAVFLGAAVAASFTCRPTNAIAVVGLTVFVVVRLRRYVRRYFAGAFAVAVPWMMVNTLAYGSVLPAYYRAGKVGLHDEYGLALATNLISPARGLLLFSPIVALGVFGVLERTRGELKGGLLSFDRLLLGLSIGYLLASAGPSDNWWGGHSFGPRFTSDTLVFFAATATPTVAMLMRRRTVLTAVATALLAWSVFVNAQGGTMRSTLCWNGEPNIDENTDRLWDWGDSQMLSGVQAIFDDGIGDAFLTRCTETD